MHPAYSVIFFTTASGCGYGMLVLLGVLNMGGHLPQDRWLGLSCFVISFALITFGLLSSAFHLGHPERSWRAFSQWRSSWLSREGVLAVFTYIPAGLFALGWVWFEETGGPWAWLGLLAAMSAALTVFCTSMIYNSLRSIPAWANDQVAPVYLVLSLATGALWLDALTRLFGQNFGGFTITAIVFLIAGVVLKSQYWRSLDTQAPASTVETATGLGRLGKVHLMDFPHSSRNYLQKEMGYRVARKHAAKLRKISLITLFALSILAALSSLLWPALSAIFAVIAVLSSSFGVVIERWLFFAEARHVVNLYYGDE